MLQLQETTLCVQSEAAMQTCFVDTLYCRLLSAIQIDIAALLHAQAWTSVLHGLYKSGSMHGMLADPEEVSHASN